MKAIILAAGIGRRIQSVQVEPKILLSFNDRTLLERHVENLEQCGVDEVMIVTGYRAPSITHALQQRRTKLPVHTIHNPDYQQGSLVSLMTAADILENAQESFLLMDGDVLYDPRIMRQLIDSPHEDALAVDCGYSPDAEAVKVCLRHDGAQRDGNERDGAQRDGTQYVGNSWRIIDFHKKLHVPSWDRIGESVGFFKLSPQSGKFLVQRGHQYLARGENLLWYEETIRDAVIDSSAPCFGIEDITGLAWVEIDSAKDWEHARTTILPRLDAHHRDSHHRASGKESHTPPRTKAKSKSKEQKEHDMTKLKAP